VTAYQFEAQCAWLFALIKAPKCEGRCRDLGACRTDDLDGHYPAAERPHAVALFHFHFGELADRGNAFSIALTGIDAHHLWHGLHE